MAKRFEVAGLLVAALALLVGCESLPPEYRPERRPTAAWEKQLRELKCDYRRHSLSIRSRDPLVFATTAVCFGGHVARKHPGLGYLSLVLVDTARNEVQASRITANWEGGLHHTASGDLMWFSTGNAGMTHTDQRFIEVFAAKAGTVTERSLGRLELPFAAYSPFVHLGEGCHVLMVSAFRRNYEDPYRTLAWVFRDEDPVGTAKPVEGVGRILYWNPVGKYFVTQKQVHVDVGPKHSDVLERSRLTCSGELATLPGEDAERLANVTYMSASYLPLPNGDLVVASKVADPDEGGAGELLVFQGDGVQRAGPFSLQMPDCPDLSCVPLGMSVLLHDASASGRHLLMELIPVDVFTVYRLEDLAKVRRWPTSKPSDRYMHVLIDDATVMQLENGGRVAYYSLTEPK